VDAGELPQRLRLFSLHSFKTTSLIHTSNVFGSSKGDIEVQAPTLIPIMKVLKAGCDVRSLCLSTCILSVLPLRRFEFCKIWTGHLLAKGFH
jgi:hypothetical protein